MKIEKTYQVREELSEYYDPLVDPLKARLLEYDSLVFHIAEKSRKFRRVEASPINVVLTDKFDVKYPSGKEIELPLAGRLESIYQILTLDGIIIYQNRAAYMAYNQGCSLPSDARGKILLAGEYFLEDEKW